LALLGVDGEVEEGHDAIDPVLAAIDYPAYTGAVANADEPRTSVRADFHP
jgi:hypothetical protein